MKKFLCGIVGLLLAFSLMFPFSASAISESQKNVISQYCSSMIQNFKTLQHVDVDTRVKLGSRYETAISKFMIPLNLRIIKNNLSVPELAELQKSFADHRANFNSNFTKYSKHLDELISINCQNHQEDFYNKLLETREAREDVRKEALQLNSILHKYKEIVEKVRKEL